MNLIVVGLSHKTADVELRERLAFKEETLPEALLELVKRPGLEEALIISTCNRVEVAAAASQTEDGLEQLVGFLVEKCGAARETLFPHLYLYSGDDAFRHVFRVASSLDSLVIGESQVLGQVKGAFETALAHKTTAAVLNKVFKKAISVAKRVRTETAISQLRVSVSSVAVELAEKIFGSLSDKSVFIVGAGEMAELALKHLADGGTSEVMITTRDFQKAKDLAAEVQGRAVAFESFHSEITHADIIICSTGATHYLITPENVAAAVRKRDNRPIFMIDISVPRNIDPAVNEIDNVFLYDVDDLNHIVQQNLKERAAQAEQAEEMVEAEVAGMQRWLKTLDVVPTIVAIREKGEAIKKAELDKLLSKANGLKPEHVKAIEALSSAIINKLLHAPMVALKQQSSNPEAALYVETARKLFNLDHEEGKCPHRAEHD